MSNIDLKKRIEIYKKRIEERDSSKEKISKIEIIFDDELYKKNKDNVEITDDNKVYIEESIYKSLQERAVEYNIPIEDLLYNIIYEQLIYSLNENKSKEFDDIFDQISLSVLIEELLEELEKNKEKKYLIVDKKMKPCCVLLSTEYYEKIKNI